MSGRDMDEASEDTVTILGVIGGKSKQPCCTTANKISTQLPKIRMIIQAYTQRNTAEFAGWNCTILYQLCINTI